MSLPPRRAPVGAPSPRAARRRAASAWLRRGALSLALAGLALAAGAAWLRAGADADRAEARAHLLRGDLDEAARLYARLAVWPWSRRLGEAGRALCEAARAEPASEVTAPAVAALSPPSSATITASPLLAELEPLVERALAVGDLAAARALGALAGRWGHALAPLWQAALAFESGDSGAAKDLADASPWLLAGRGLGQRLAAALAARAAGARTLVHDRNGERIGTLDAEGRFVPDARVDPAWMPEALVAALEARGTRAAGVRASLDLDLSRLAQAALGRARGTIVMVDPRRGDVLAAVSDARSSRRGGTPALEERREPASISKVITAAAALRAALDPDAVIARLTCTGAARFGSGTLWCAYRAGRLQGLDEALAVSCNMAFAELGVAVGREALVAELRRWGFDRPAPELLGAAGRIRQPQGDERQLADLAVGLEATDITPLHAALLPTVLADEGRMPEPRLVVGDEGPLGLDRRLDPVPPARPVIDPAWIPTLRRAMEAVAFYGTAAGIQPVGYPVAMKTGTAAEWRAGYHVNYVGIAPSPDAEVAFCVRVTYQPTSTRVNRVAREVLRALLRGLAARHGQPYLTSRLTLPNPTPEP